MPTHLLLDAARMEDAMDRARELNPLHASLYRNKEGQDEILPSVAPFLFTYPYTADFEEFVMGEGWGNSWGLWVESNAEFEELYKHFRRFLMVQTEDGQELYFRFYDPRVLRIFLPTCDQDQLAEFFGPVSQFVMEDEDPAFCILFSLWQAQLFVDRQDASLLKYILNDEVSG
ncbi:DUF4123 domain-containing protein [Dyadobacter chenwenxiniae]|uniref:DUF4123 domain-containing protein n=1 Tax=Dyadobacter chenwenxiniae TaxID=2906456 RepID=A0A9X1TCY4_9BACT|nr:DUF4123 domain-containing protein [Dyadobacter chenwenxiniae]MCF0060627.1 DUF4123 domain-containing protein [Dyadobacter chenwenxiniae]UON80459.1 DUF4123 domain-containing protein [Dyadobacter chenwenxiniae]